MILNMRLEGLPEEVVNELVNKGIASNKSEAIRLVILHYNEHFGITPLNREKKIDEDERFYQKINAHANKDVWDNDADEKMSQWYLKRAKK
ncbi:MAG: hypothetical protein ABII39_06525 [Candidatus Micrarchaeota archaeon]